MRLLHGCRHRSVALSAAALSSTAVLALTGFVSTPGAAQSLSTPPVAAPYLEMGGAHPGNLSAAIDAGLSSVSAAFVIGKGCTPIWDDGKPVATDSAVTKAIQDAQDRGVEVVVSFGGAGGTDLARSCTKLSRLVSAYQSVVTTLDITSLDFDVEGDAIKPVQEKASIARRFSAIRALESANPGLVVSATLGVGRDGLPPDQMSFLRVARRSGTRVDLVNLMTMDYGGAVADMGAAALRATRASLAQLQSLWPSYTYAALGITPMIGENDSAGEVTTLADASTIAVFARDNGVGRVSFWSLNRDQQCGAAAAKPRGGCSGVQQARLAFTRIFLGA